MIYILFITRFRKLYDMTQYKTIINQSQKIFQNLVQSSNAFKVSPKRKYNLYLFSKSEFLKGSVSDAIHSQLAQLNLTQLKKHILKIFQQSVQHEILFLPTNVGK